MNALIPLNGQMPSAFQSRAMPDMLPAASANLTSGFGVISMRGRAWRTRYKGNEDLLADANGAPVPTLDVVIVGIADGLAKTYYAKGYSDGDEAAPSCFSNDGKVPAASVAVKQSASCQSCPQNQFGSKISENGKKIKACGDSRIIAVVPAIDIANEVLGGPMMFRIPVMSLNNLANYAKALAGHGAQPYAVVTRLKFDYAVTYPMVDFQAVSWIDDEQAAQVLEVLDDPNVDRILHGEGRATESAPEPTSTSGLFGGGPAKTLSAPTPEPEPPVEPAPAPAPTPTPPPAPVAAAAQPRRGAFGAAAPAGTPPQPASQPVPQARQATATRPSAFTKPAAAPTPVEAAPVTTVVQGMPADMEAAIDALIDG